MTPLSPNMLALLAQCAERNVPITETHSATAAALMARGAADYRRRGTRLFLGATKPGKDLLAYASKAHLMPYRDTLKTYATTKRTKKEAA